LFHVGDIARQGLYHQAFFFQRLDQLSGLIVATVVGRNLNSLARQTAADCCTNPTGPPVTNATLFSVMIPSSSLCADLPVFAGSAS
jgi:hypothetical protein